MDAWLRERAIPLHREQDLDALVEAVGDRRLVLLGEASHGTSEFYTWRAAITKRLVFEKGFRIVAVEGDWPACREVDRFVKGEAHGGPEDALRAFARWPSWMWANEEAASLVSWLRSWNEHRPGREVGFYGLDVYSLWESLDAVLAYVEEHDPAAVPAARRALDCLSPYARDEEDYARATRWVPASCEDAVVALLARMQASRDGAAAFDAYPDASADASSPRRRAAFDADQNALVARNAEAYYRAMVRSGPESWNLRDEHMMETLERLLAREGLGGKAVVWAHNTHVGDARATDMKDDGMLNLGQLARERHAGDVFVVGFSTYEGSVVAGRSWGAPMQRMPVPRARPGSLDARLHEALREDALVLLEGAPDVWGEQRAIGVVYDPARESWGNYVPTNLARRYDAILHVDRSSALRPLFTAPVAVEEPPETWPWGE